MWSYGGLNHSSQGAGTNPRMLNLLAGGQNFAQVDALWNVESGSLLALLPSPLECGGPGLISLYWNICIRKTCLWRGHHQGKCPFILLWDLTLLIVKLKDVLLVGKKGDFLALCMKSPWNSSVVLHPSGFVGLLQCFPHNLCRMASWVK